MQSAAKAARYIPLLVLLAAMAGCSLFGTTRKERVLRFEDGLNENRAYLYQDFYEPLTTDYATLQDADVSVTWDIWFPPGYPEPGTFTLSVEDYSVDVIEAVVTGPDADAEPMTLQLYMTQVGLDWYLERLDLDGVTIVD